MTRLYTKRKERVYRDPGDGGLPSLARFRRIRAGNICCVTAFGSEFVQPCFHQFHQEGRDVMAKNPKVEVEEATTSEVSEEQLERIRQRAHELYVVRGQEDGHDLEDWLQAEAEIGAGKAPVPES